MITFSPTPDDQFQALHIPAGGRWARPYWFDYSKRDRLRLRFAFTDSCRYALPGAEQLDWNKLAGVSFDIWTNHRDSGMFSWRYNPDSDRVELGVYVHRSWNRQACYEPRKKGLELPRHVAEVYVSVLIGQPVDCVLEIDRRNDALSFDLRTPEENAQDMIFYDRTIPTRVRVINPWFGGTLPAPGDVWIMRQSI